MIAMNCTGGYWTTECCPNCCGSGRVSRWIPWVYTYPYCNPCPPCPPQKFVYGGNARSDSARARA